MEDREMQQLKQILTDKRDRIHRRLRKIHADVEHKDGPLDKDIEDQAIELENDEVLDKLEPATRQELADVLAALERMEEGTYGKCLDCGDAISLSRLKAIPYTLRCIECAEEAEAQR